MGYCFSSTNATATGDPNQQQQSDFQSPPKSESKSPPPPPPLEEEAVKEIVISEIPISSSACSIAAAIVEEENLQKAELFINKQVKTETPPNEFSQVSGGYTEISFSTTTTTTIREDHDEADSKLSIKESSNNNINRGPIHNMPRKRPYNGRRKVPQSPAKGAEEHHGRRLGSSSSKNVGVRSKQRNVGLARPRTLEVALGVGGPVKAVEESGGRLLGNVESGDKICAEEMNESLENPHVSLECFIFL